MLRIAIAAVAIVLSASTVLAQDTGNSDQETIRLLVQQVKELQQKVKTLEAAQSSVWTEPAGQVPPIPAPSQAVPRGEPVTTDAPPLDLHDLHGIHWLGFGEVDYKVLDQRKPELGTFGFTPGSAGNFYTGDFDLFLTSRINDKATVLSEIVFGEGPDQTFNVDLERLLFKYDYRDYLRLSFGRYHTGVGYYNTAFHSGRWLQTTADRPLIMEYATDGGLLPTQAVGIAITGLVPPFAKLGLNYEFEYGTSDTVRPDINGSNQENDENNGNHILLGAFLRPDAVPGLQIGGSYYHDQISNEDLTPPPRLNQTIVNAHVVYVAHRIEFLNEGFLIRQAQINGSAAFNMPAFYTQFSRSFGRIRPFFRFQYVNTNQDSIYNDVLLRYGPSFGARYDFNGNFAFKTQLDHTIRKGEPDLNGLQFQLAFTF